MSGHISIERMNESLDGLLTMAERERLARHLEACATCRNEYARLAETLAAVRALPRSAMPPAEAWQAIAARVAAADGEGGEYELVTDVTVHRLPTAQRRQRRVALSIAQLAAAAALVALLSAAVVWIALGGAGAVTAPGVASAEPTLGPAARAVAMEDQPYVEVVDQLERMLVEGRGLLAPETLASIEESLLTLDAAIADVEAALADDPASPLLLRLLANHQRTKLGVLQRAAAAVRAQT